MAPRVSSREIVGREEARAVVEGVLDRAAEGSPRICLIGGEAGIGKTRLVAHLEQRARDAGFLVLHGESVEFGGDDLPYAPVLAALRTCPPDRLTAALEELSGDARRGLAALLPGSAAVPEPPPDRLAGSHGQGRLYELLLAL